MNSDYWCEITLFTLFVSCAAVNKEPTYRLILFKNFSIPLLTIYNSSTWEVPPPDAWPSPRPPSPAASSGTSAAGPSSAPWPASRRGSPCPWDGVRGQIHPAILQNPGMDTYPPTEPLNPGKDALILLWPSKLVQMSFFGKINLQFQAF